MRYPKKLCRKYTKDILPDFVGYTAWFRECLSNLHPNLPIVDVDSYWTFQSFVDHQWALDVESNGYNVFGYTITNASAQLWTLYALPEDSTTTHQFYSGAWSKSMNVDSNNAVFMDSQSKGQAWYFREVEPQTTVTSTTTSTYVQHATTTVTATTTITTCVVQGLGKRDATGSDLLSTTTHTNWITQTVTDTQTDATQTFTSTNTVFSCKPTTVVSTQPGSTIVSISTQPGTTVVSVSMDTGPSATNKGSSSSATGSTVSLFRYSGFTRLMDHCKRN